MRFLRVCARPRNARRDATRPAIPRADAENDHPPPPLVRSASNPAHPVARLSVMGSSDGPATRRESRNVQSQYASKPGFAAVANGKRQRVSTSAEPDDGVANGPNTPATTNSGGTPNKPTRGDSSGSEGAAPAPRTRSSARRGTRKPSRWATRRAPSRTAPTSSSRNLGRPG